METFITVYFNTFNVELLVNYQTCVLYLYRCVGEAIDLPLCHRSTPEDYGIHNAEGWLANHQCTSEPSNLSEIV